MGKNRSLNNDRAYHLNPNNPKYQGKSKKE